MTDFTQTHLTKISRAPQRGSYERELINTILDDAIDITISYVENGLPRAIPTGFVRIEDKLYIHGSVKSHFVQQICAKEKVCLTVSLLDGLVLANTAFNHSFNYRSVILYSSPYEVLDEEVKMHSLKAFTDKLLPGRWEDNIRLPTPEEMKITTVVCLPIEEASAKTREGQPKNQKIESKDEVWTGHVPLLRKYTAPVPDPDSEGMEVPAYFRNLYQDNSTFRDSRD